MEQFESATRLLAAAKLLLGWSVQAQQPDEFKQWPAGTSPQEIGERVAERLAPTPRAPAGV